MTSRFFSALAIVALCLFGAERALAQASNDHTVLILGESVTGGSSSLEAQAAANLGYDVEVVTDGDWSTMSADDFATYRAIIIGDPTCVYNTNPIDAAIANGSTWGGVLDGNILIIGTDPVYHATYYDSDEEQSGALALIQQGMEFVLSTPIAAGRTGAYITLSCSYEYTDGNADLLDGVGNGNFNVAHTDCHNDAHIVAFHPALEDLTDADLSNWGCSIHSVFTSWDTDDFEVLAIGEGLGSSYTDEDGSSGSPYILAKGVCNVMPTITVSLSPDVLWSPNNQMANITATVNVTGDNTTVELVSITSDEGDEANDVGSATTGTADYAFQLRKQRDGSGDGRVYTVTYRVTDDCGNTATASATVSVPHDQGN
ncbi:MAG TPA: hypothetical protein VNA88_19200 [Candidatus Kapabacteria bacterium]|nr:hypothetical protein [Candidatus Kapabacteria bacterium]